MSRKNPSCNSRAVSNDGIPACDPGGKFSWPDGLSTIYKLDKRFEKFMGPGSNPAGWEVGEGAGLLESVPVLFSFHHAHAHRWCC